MGLISGKVECFIMASPFQNTTQALLDSTGSGLTWEGVAVAVSSFYYHGSLCFSEYWKQLFDDLW